MARAQTTLFVNSQATLFFCSRRVCCIPALQSDESDSNEPIGKSRCLQPLISARFAILSIGFVTFFDKNFPLFFRIGLVIFFIEVILRRQQDFVFLMRPLPICSGDGDQA